MTRLYAIAALAIALALSAWGNLHQWREAAATAAQHDAAMQTATDANKAIDTAITAITADRDTCLAKLTQQQLDADALAHVREAKVDYWRTQAASRKAELAEVRATPACKTWAAQPSCGVGQWDVP